MNTLLIVISSNKNNDFKCSTPWPDRACIHPAGVISCKQPTHLLSLLAYWISVYMALKKGSMKKSCPYSDLFPQWDTARGDWPQLTILLLIPGPSPGFWLAKFPVVKDYNRLGSRTSSSFRSHCGIYNHHREDPRSAVMGLSRGEIVLAVMQEMVQGLGNMFAESYNHHLPWTIHIFNKICSFVFLYWDI